MFEVMVATIPETHYQKHKTYYNGYSKQYYQKNKEKIAARTRARYLLKRDALLRYAKDWQLLKLYGLTRQQFDSMLDQQHGCCAICEIQMVRPCVDHCHSTQKIRGLLCNSCNVGLANFRDSVQRMKRAIKYLEDGKCP